MTERSQHGVLMARLAVMTSFLLATAPLKMVGCSAEAVESELGIPKNGGVVSLVTHTHTSP